MHQTCLCLGVLLLVVNLCSSYPTGTGLSNEDTIILKDLLYNLEESIAEQTDVARPSPAQRNSLDGLDREEPEDRQQPQKDLDEAVIRTFLSAKNLKSVRNNSSRNSSGCFGRRMDRIGSMSSLGCNTVGRYNAKSA